MRLIGASHTPEEFSVSGALQEVMALSWLECAAAWLLVEFGKPPHRLAIVSQQFLGKAGSMHSCPPAQGVGTPRRFPSRG